MNVRIKQIGIKGKMASLLILLVLVPAIFYSAYEFTALSRSESLISDVYRQQLDVVLFSLNQYSWDVTNSWANRIDDAMLSAAVFRRDISAAVNPFLKTNSGIRCVFVSENPETDPRVMSVRPDTGAYITARTVRSSLGRQSEAVERLLRLQESGYRKIVPLLIDDESGQQFLALIFASGKDSPNRPIIGIVIDAERYVRDVLARKMVEAGGEDFVLSVNQKHTDRIIYSTSQILPGDVRQSKDLWLFPNYTIGIGLKGQTIEDVARSRFYWSLFLIGLLNVVLIAGVWFVYKTVRREVELAQLKSDFVSNVSHEIKTPLALIRMFAETLQLKRVKSAKKKEEYYDTIVKETERLTRLINNILNFSRMEAGKKEYRFEPMDLNGLVQGVLRDYAAHLEHQGFKVGVQTRGGLPRIVADAGAVSEALLNIIDNSVKYSRERKILNVSTGSDHAMVYVDIEDHGIGIPPQQQKKIFEKFYRVSSGLVHDVKGAGLGLSLVKHIMDAHQGTVTLKSDVGKGSTFRLSFPIHTNKVDRQEMP